MNEKVDETNTQGQQGGKVHIKAMYRKAIYRKAIYRKAVYRKESVSWKAR